MPLLAIARRRRLVLWLCKHSSGCDQIRVSETLILSFQSIRSKMSIRADDKPKSFHAQFLSTEGKLKEYGAFDFKPGAIVSGKTR